MMETEIMDTKKMELYSKSGDLIPPKGEVFQVTRRAANGEDEVVEITLHDTLVGLYTKPKSGNKTGRTQAMTFASFAIQKGFTSEEEILERYPDIAVNLDPNQVPTSRAWRLCDQWGSELENERNVKAAETQRSNGKVITQGQVDNALRLIPMLEAKQGETKAFSKTIERLGNFISEHNFDTEDPKGGDFSLAIAGAYKILGIQRNGNSTPSTSSETENTEEEPF